VACYFFCVSCVFVVDGDENRGWDVANGTSLMDEAGRRTDDGVKAGDKPAHGLLSLVA